MATVEVYEMASIGNQGIRRFPVLAKQILTIGSTTHLSAAFGSGTMAISAISTAAWRAAIATTPSTVGGSHIYVPGETYFDAEVVPGQKLLALSSTTT